MPRTGHPLDLTDQLIADLRTRVADLLCDLDDERRRHRDLSTAYSRLVRAAADLDRKYLTHQRRGWGRISLDALAPLHDALEGGSR